MKTKLRSAAAIVIGTILFSAKLFAADFEIKNEAEFRKCIPADSTVKKIAGGMRFLEGPVWRNEGIGALVFSDIPGNELKQWSEKQGVITYRKPSNNAIKPARIFPGRFTSNRITDFPFTETGGHLSS